MRNNMKKFIFTLALFGMLPFTTRAAVPLTPPSTPAQPPVEIHWAVTSDWGSGHCANTSIKNTSEKNMSQWSMRPITPVNTTSVWSALHENTIFRPESWTASIAVGQTVSFGYCADGAGVVPEYAHFGIRRPQLLVAVVDDTPVAADPGAGTGETGEIEDNPANETNTGSTTLSLPDAAAYLPIGEILVGAQVPLYVWGENAVFTPHSPQWGLALAHAAKMAEMAGLDRNYNANAFFATAIKESFLKCEDSTFTSQYNHDGCFQIESGTAFEEMKRMYSVFAGLNHTDVITNSFVTSALTKAYYDVFTMNMLDDHFGYNASGFIHDSADENALVKTVALAYNRGLWWNEFGSIFNTDRVSCVSKTNMMDCVQDETAHDYGTALAEYYTALNNAPQWYDPQLTWADFDSYIDAITPMNPGIDMTAVKAQALETFITVANGSPSISFRAAAGSVLDTIILHTWRIQDPSVSINEWY